jgi:hypothetical protein
MATRDTFLRVLAECGHVSASAEAAGIGRAALYKWRQDDPNFAAAWEEALVVGADALEDEAKRRAMDGSDALLIFLLKGLKADRFGQKSQIDITNNLQMDLRKMPIEELYKRLDYLRAQQDGLLVLAGPSD